MAITRKDPSLGKKLEYLAGILGATLPSTYFTNKYQANRMQIDEAQMTKKKAGREAISNQQLSTLIDMFRLGGQFDHGLFLMEYEEFVEALKSAKVGTHGPPASLRYRRILIDAADPSSPIVICREAPQRGGIGTTHEGSNWVTLAIHDKIYLHIPLPDDGHLLVLNDSPQEDTFDCLLPSTFAMDTLVSGNSVRLPSERNLPHFPVGGPTGFYRLFALWSRDSLLSHLPRNPSLNAAPTQYAGGEIGELANAVLHGRQGGQGIQVMMGEYYVK